MLCIIQTVPLPKALKPMTENTVCDTPETCSAAATLTEAKANEILRHFVVTFWQNYCFRMV